LISVIVDRYDVKEVTGLRYDRMLDNKNVIITGTSEIAKTTAGLFIEHGANVVVAGPADVTDDELMNVEYFDTGHDFDVIGLCNRYKNRYIAPDVWFNCIDTFIPGFIDEIEDEELDKIINFYITMPFLFMKEMLPAMVANETGGSIIQMCSYVLGGHNGVSGYAAGNGGLFAMTNALAMEYAPHGIRANTIIPGLSLVCEDTDVEEGYWERTQLLKRKGTKTEIANLALFLASDMSKHITAEAIYINGGQHIIPHNNTYKIHYS